jgi:hypothetical protein
MPPQQAGPDTFYDAPAAAMDQTKGRTYLYYVGDQRPEELFSQDGWLLTSRHFDYAFYV